MGRQDPPPIPLDRQEVKRRLLARFWTRFHMSLILLSCGLAAMLANKLMRVMGVDAMAVRYPVAVVVSYLTFLAGVWVWLRYVGLHDAIHGTDGRKPGKPRRHGRSFDGASLPDVSVSGSWDGGAVLTGGGDAVAGQGGTFDGGGASASWEGSGTDKLTYLPSVTKSSSSGSGGFDLGDVGDAGDGIALVLLALLVVAAILFSSGYLIWMAPDILAEAAFGALLAGGLARPARREDAAGWMAGVMKKTWWPFAIVLVLALALGGFIGSQYPKARTFGEAMEMAGEPAVTK